MAKRVEVARAGTDPPATAPEPGPPTGGEARAPAPTGAAFGSDAPDAAITSGTSGTPDTPDVPGGDGETPVAARRQSLGIAARIGRVAGALWRPVLVLAAVFGVWWYITWQDYMPQYLVPAPGSVAETMVEEWRLLATNTYVTAYETVLGFILAAVFGMLAAVLIVYSRTLERALYPLILFAQVIPKIAIAPILIVWFGFGPSPKIILAVLISFFPVVISGVTGLRSTDPELLDLSATMGASRWQTFRKVRFPGALPHLLSGLKVAVTLAVVGAVVGEFVGADTGLGRVLLVASGNLNAPLLFADLILMSAIGVALFVVMEIVEALLIPWHASRREGGSISLTTS